MNARRLYGACVLLVLTACGTTPPSRLYVLDTPLVEQVASIDEDLRLVVGPITIPAYLERPQIVVRDGGRLLASDFDRWSEPLLDGIALALTRQVSAAGGIEALPFLWPGGLGESWRLPIEITRFEAETPARFVLEARWVLMSPKSQEVGERQRRRYETSVDVGDYNAIVAASSELLGRLAADIAVSAETALASVP